MCGAFVCTSVHILTLVPWHFRAHALSRPHMSFTRLSDLADVILRLAGQLAADADLDAQAKRKFNKLNELLGAVRPHLKVLVAILDVFKPVIKVCISCVFKHRAAGGVPAVCLRQLLACLLV